ncbi:hypothetical protein [Desulforamulus putei]|uniref:hypothetical protein n=1 Tax=Desulforamulus putei TaxID=74701 RepID=UPI0009330DE6|nr:hypothetical protein [Desulforamulus putei]
MSNKVKILPIPTLSADSPGERLTEFYRKLGWDGEAILDPVYVRLTEEDWQNLMIAEVTHAKAVITNMNESDIIVGMGMLWANIGPSGGGKTPGMVELHPGWVS